MLLLFATQLSSVHTPKHIRSLESKHLQPLPCQSFIQLILHTVNKRPYITISQSGKGSNSYSVNAGGAPGDDMQAHAQSSAHNSCSVQSILKLMSHLNKTLSIQVVLY